MICRSRRATFKEVKNTPLSPGLRLPCSDKQGEIHSPIRKVHLLTYSSSHASERSARNTRAFGEEFRAAGTSHRGVVGNFAAKIEIVEARIHEDHAFPRTCLQAVLELMELAFADRVSHRGVRNEKLERQCSSAIN